MLDSLIKPKIDPMLNKIADALGKIGIGPNQITLYGFVIGIIGCIAIGMQSYLFGLFLILLNRLFDGIDGAVARFNAQKEEQKDSLNNSFGAYLDIILDMILFGAFVFLFALGQPHQASAAAFLLFSFIGVFATSLGYYVVSTNKKGGKNKKLFLHPTRLVEGTEIILFMILACLYPIAFSAIAVLFGVLCWVTTTARIWYAFLDSRKE